MLDDIKGSFGAAGTSAPAYREKTFREGDR